MMAAPVQNSQSDDSLRNQTLTPRTYQTELLNHVNDRNSIICMGTGTGKTFIAVMLIKERAHEVEKPFLEGGKRTFFLTNSVTLARQQGAVIRQHTNLKVQTYVGSDGVDDWMIEPGRWEVEFKRHQVLVMTAQILLNLLQHGILAFSKINLLIFDECHHAKKNHAYVKIMEIGSAALQPGEKGPHVLGLTASILDRDLSSCDKLEENIRKIEQKLQSTAVTSADQESVEKYGTKPNETIIEYEYFEDKYDFTEKLNQILDGVYRFLTNCEYGYKKLKRKSEAVETTSDQNVAVPDALVVVMKCLDDYRVVLNILGSIAANAVAEKHLVKLKKDVTSPVIPVEVNRRFYRLGITIFSELVKEYDDFYREIITSLDVVDELCQPRVRQLIHEILYKYSTVDNNTVSTEDDVKPDGYDDPFGCEESDDSDMVVEDEGEEEMDDNDSSEEEEEEEGNKDAEDDDDYIPMESEGQLNKELTGIIFVERRVTSFALHKLLEMYFNWDENLCILKSGYIVGGGGKTDREIQQTERHHEATLRAFRNKGINLLVSTSVLQEGIDIPKCNLVVLFDAPKNYREYVQAKGRARAANSNFYILASESEIDDCTKRIQNYQSFEEVIASKCLNRDENKDEEENAIEDADSILPPYMGPVMEGISGRTRAMVTMTNAVGLVNQYCNLLPSDSYTRLVPDCKYTEIGTQFQCTVQLPVCSPVREPVTSPVMPRKKLAQMAAALKVCELLHKCGELSDHLLPIYGSEFFVGEDEKLGDAQGGGGGGGDGGEIQAPGIAKLPRVNAKRKRIYPKRFPACTSESLIQPGKPAYLYEISLKLTALAKEYNGPRQAPEDTPRNFAILLSQELPKLPDFPIYVRAGEVTVQLKMMNDQVVLSKDQVERALIFHRYIFQKVLGIERENFTSLIFDAEHSSEQVTLVPILRTDKVDDIDWDFVNLIVGKKDLPYQTCGKKFKWDIDMWKDAVVTRTYREPPMFYHINEICLNMNPHSTFPNENYINFSDYYSTRYAELGLKIKNTKQPLLDVSQVSKRMNLLTCKYLTSKGTALPSSDKERHLTHFVPELCGIHVFPASMWRKATTLPSILYRLTNLLNAHELRVRVNQEAGICPSKVPENHSYPKLDYGFKLQAQLRPINVENGMETDHEDTMKVFESLIGMDDMKDSEREFQKRRIELEQIEKLSLFADVLHIPDARYGPSAGHILQALTMASANDFFSLERMELMGDSFLKCTMSIYLFVTNPQFHEGKLTSHRMAMTSNANLYRLACEKHIPEMIVSEHFAPCDKWLPPLYNAKEVKPVIREGRRGQEDEIIAYCMKRYQLLFDKSIADSVEALIGCYLITSGADAARKLLNWLGLPLNLETWRKLPSEIPDPILKDEGNWEEALRRQASGLKAFEESLQYTFKNKAFLIEALTHPSYHKNRVTQSYQRLEFLGDAVLDYVITRFLFEDSRQHSPGLLTDLRSALVNNNVFAKIAVKHDYHLSFKYLSPNLYYLIDKFVNHQNNNNHQLYADEFDQFDDDVEIPKALGDIFESVAGAIFLDSGMCLDTVWEVHYRMMKDLIVNVTLTLPKSPIRELMELAPHSVSFSQPVKTANDKVKVTVTVLGNRGKYDGTARNHRQARLVAAKKAVRKLKEAAQAGFIMGQV